MVTLTAYLENVIVCIFQEGQLNLCGSFHLFFYCGCCCRVILFFQMNKTNFLKSKTSASHNSSLCFCTEQSDLWVSKDESTPHILVLLHSAELVLRDEPNLSLNIWLPFTIPIHFIAPALIIRGI